MQTQPILNSHTVRPETARGAARFVAGLFVVACLLADAVLAVHLAGNAGLVIALYLGATFGQLTLAAIWCTDGSLPWPVRGMLALVLAGALARGWSRATYATWNQWLAVLVLYTLAAAVMARAAEVLLGGRHSQADARADRGPRAAHAHHRWSLGGMLSVMTVIGLILGPGRWLAIPSAQAGAVVGHLAALLSVAAITLWAVRSAARFTRRIGAISAVSLGAGLFMAWLEPSLGAWYFVLACLNQAALISLGHDLLFAGQELDG